MDKRSAMFLGAAAAGWLLAACLFFYVIFWNSRTPPVTPAAAPPTATLAEQLKSGGDEAPANYLKDCQPVRLQILTNDATKGIVNAALLKDRVEALLLDQKIPISHTQEGVLLTFALDGMQDNTGFMLFVCQVTLSGSSYRLRGGQTFRIDSGLWRDMTYGAASKDRITAVIERTVLEKARSFVQAYVSANPPK